MVLKPVEGGNSGDLIITMQNGSNSSHGDASQNQLPESASCNIETLSWSDLTINARVRSSERVLRILDGSSGYLSSGKLCAIMGPSGCGKSTLISALSGRPTNASTARGSVRINGEDAASSTLQSVSCFAGQQDRLIGSLTVFESMAFSAKFANHRDTAETMKRATSMIERLGLADCQNNQVEALFKKPISGGQKRRVTIGCQLLTDAKVLFLDEPTSGLDSVSSLEVIKYLSKIAKESGCIIVCAIHQPSTSALHLFDQLLLMSSGKTIFFGETAGVNGYFEEYCGIRLPQHIGLAEGLLSIVNFDFERPRECKDCSLQDLAAGWQASPELARLRRAIDACHKDACQNDATATRPASHSKKRPSQTHRFFLLLHRTYIKSYRDISGYWVRLVMYACFGVVMGTIFNPLPPEGRTAQSRVLELFFTPVFLAFMSVAYAPAFIEDYEIFIIDHRNRFYGAAQLLLANFLVGIPYLLLYSVLVSVFVYWISDFRPSGSAFCVWVLWQFLNFLAAESLVVFAVALFPNFVVVLSLVSFINSLWIAVAGVAVPVSQLNAFYRYVFHYIDSLTYVFRGLMVNEFAHRNYSCGKDCQCSYPGAPFAACTMPGQVVLDNYGISKTDKNVNFACSIAIIAAYRFLAFVVLQFRAKRS